MSGPARANDYSRFLTSQGRSIPHGTSSGSQTDSVIPETMPDVPPVAPAQPVPQSPVDDITIDQLLASPGHDLLPRLDPRRPPGTLWFEDDNSVATQVRIIFERDFKEPHANWKQTPDYVVKRWFKSFAQIYHWDSVYTATVRAAFEKKVKERLLDQISRWKGKWIADTHYMPRWMDPTIWDGLIQYWLDPAHKKRSDNSRAARYSSTDGNGPSKHRSGKTSYRARARKIADRTGNPIPDLLAVLEETKRKPDGSFVDSQSEQVFNEVTSRMQELVQDDLESMASGGLSPIVKNKIYTEVAPRKKGRIFGVGSLQSKVEAACSLTIQPENDPVALRQIISTQAKLIETQQEKMSGYDLVMSYLSRQDPAIAMMLNRNNRSTESNAGTETGTETEPSATS